MELKVLCDCGQKFVFDVEPVGGLMPFQVNCPACGTDRTTAANAILARSPGTAAPSIPIPLPVPVTEVSASSLTPLRVAPEANPSGGLRINRPAPSEPPLPPPVSAGVIPTDAPAPRRPRPLPAHTPLPKYMQTNQAIQNNNFFMGVLGAFLGLMAGMALLFTFFYLMGPMFFLIGIFGITLRLILGSMVGSITGYGARLFYRGTDLTLGAAAAAMVLLVFGGFLFVFGGALGFLFGLITLGPAMYSAFKVASG